MAHLYIIRGVPGSGKTTLAKKMIQAGMAEVHAEADMFMVDYHGNYEFNPARLKDCHQSCKNLVDAAMQVEKDVIVSNTFTRKWEMQDYLDMAEDNGYQVTVIVCQGEYANEHNVPDAKVVDMRNRFEW